jgi:hypothetical protein
MQIYEREVQRNINTQMSVAVVIRVREQQAVSKLIAFVPRIRLMSVREDHKHKISPHTGFMKSVFYWGRE